MFRLSFIHVLLGAGSIASLVALGLFNSVTTKDGYHNYAERPWYFLKDLIPCITKLAMPANTVVNFGYVLVSLYWLWVTRTMKAKGLLSNHQAYMCYVFAWMSFMYAPIQLGRILTQSHKLAILDQWYTLPIFSWVIVWASFIVQGWNPGTAASIVAVSTSSYCFTLLKIAGHEEKGFEVALAFHIFGAVISGYSAFKKHPSKKAFWAFVMAVLCCAGFVGLKLLDKQLGRYNFFFKVLSGHFWSKIADFMQIHYVFVFFVSITESMNKNLKDD